MGCEKERKIKDASEVLILKTRNKEPPLTEKSKMLRKVEYHGG